MTNTNNPSSNLAAEDLALIGLDWGTSSLRAYLFDRCGRAVETRQRSWGIRQLPDGRFTEALNSITAKWPDLPLIAAGMVGSRQGWLEVPYADAPADVDDIAKNLRHIDIEPQRRLWIAPGLRDGDGPDVMRGEETQLVGALSLQPALLAQSHFVLPGTHSKWAHVQDGKIVNFTTFMTGEIYALLLQHSILGAGVTQREAGATVGDAFALGVIRARDSQSAGALSRLFSTRAWMLEGKLATDDVPDFLSGLLIGEEFRSVLASGQMRPESTVHLIGETALIERYRIAAMQFSLPPPGAITDAAAAGLWQIAQRAGLISPLVTHLSHEVQP